MTPISAAANTNSLNPSIFAYVCIMTSTKQTDYVSLVQNYAFTLLFICVAETLKLDKPSSSIIYYFSYHVTCIEQKHEYINIIRLKLKMIDWWLHIESGSVVKFQLDRKQFHTIQRSWFKWLD